MTEANIQIEDLQGAAGKIVKVVKIVGQLDESNVDEKIQEIYKIIEANPSGLNLIFDFEGLQYMNSKSIGYLTDLYGKITETGGKVIIVQAKPNILDILQVVGLTQLIKTFATKQEGLAEVNGQSAPVTAAPEAVPATPVTPVMEAPQAPAAPITPPAPAVETVATPAPTTGTLGEVTLSSPVVEPTPSVAPAEPAPTAPPATPVTPAMEAPQAPTMAEPTPTPAPAAPIAAPAPTAEAPTVAAAPAPAPAVTPETPVVAEAAPTPTYNLGQQ